MKGISEEKVVEIARTQAALGEEVDIEGLLEALDRLVKKTSVFEDKVKNLKDEVKALEERVESLEDSIQSLLQVIDETEHEPFNKQQCKDVDEAWRLLKNQQA